MTPISLGIFASANTTVPTSYESIATVTVGSGGAANIEFTSIPSTYTHLQLRCILRMTSGANNQLGGGKVTFNSDTTSANYTFHRLIGDGSSASSYGQDTLDFILRTAQNAATASVFPASIVDIFNYKDTNQYKTVRALTGGDLNNTAGILGLFSQLWENTNAITSIKLEPSEGNWAQYSHAALYGIKSA